MNDADHERLLRCILDCEGSCVLSGYDNSMYNDVLSGLEKKIFASQTTIRQKDDGRQNRTECVWIKRAKHI
jgi:DNA adenine methylase